MAFMSRPITTNEATAGFRTVFFGVYNTDGTPKTDLTAAKARLYENGAFLAESTNNFAHVDNGRYAVVLTQAEVNKSAQTHLLVGPANAAGFNVVCGEAVIVAPKVAATIAAGDIATDAFSAAAASAAFVTKIQNGLAAPGSAMTLEVAARTALVNILVRALNGADGYSVRKDPPNNRIQLTIPGEGIENIPADFNAESIGVDGVGE